MAKKRKAPPGYKFVYRMSFVHWRSKKRVYRKDGRPFCFLFRK